VSLKSCILVVVPGHWAIAEALLNQNVMVDPVDRGGMFSDSARMFFFVGNFKFAGCSVCYSGHTPLAHAMKIRKALMDDSKTNATTAGMLLRVDSVQVCCCSFDRCA